MNINFLCFTTNSGVRRRLRAREEQYYTLGPLLLLLLLLLELLLLLLLVYLQTNGDDKFKETTSVSLVGWSQRAARQ